LLRIGLTTFAVGAIAMILLSWWRRRLFATVRWQEGTVTFRSIEPGDVGEDGQYVVCRITATPPVTVTRVATRVGPLDAERLVVGATMRCRFDRASTLAVLRAYPYAKPDAPLPSGRALKFHKA
jgi:hypothetical protein